MGHERSVRRKALAAMIAAVSLAAAVAALVAWTLRVALAFLF